MSITFYYAPMTSSTRVHWALEELGVPYEKVRVDLSKGEQKKPEFLKINPNGKVAALVDDGTPMFESLAILIHLGEKYGVAKGLWPAPGTAESAEALTWLVWSTVTLGQAGVTLMTNTSERVPAEQRNAIQGENAKKAVEGCCAILEQKLEGRPYLLGDQFTLVDLANAAAVAFFSRLGVDLAPFPRVTAWVARATQRPGMAAAAAG
jgi:glutathione S-transferase